MRHMILISLLLAMTTMSSQVIRIASYNLRYDSQPDNITVQDSLGSLPNPLSAPVYYNATGEQPWSTRRVRVAEHLLSKGTIIAGELIDCDNRTQVQYGIGCKDFKKH